VAYSPFRAFRKHQKVIFAGLTILCMFVFVLTGISGLGQEWSQYFRGLYREREPEAAMINGKPLTVQDLRLKLFQRETANSFMLAAEQASAFSIQAEIQQALASSSKLDKPAKDAIQTLLYLRSQLTPQLLQSPLRDYILGEIQQKLQQLSVSLANAENASLLNKLQWLISNDFRLISRPPKEFFFGGGRDPKDLIDFVLWEREADRLGIHLAPRDVNALVTRETNGYLSGADSNIIVRNLREMYGPRLTPDFLRDALAREFRVQLAQEVIMGSGPGSPQRVSPVVVTPFELWQFYEKNRTESEIVMVSVPVDRPEFMAKVPAPTEAELRALFEKGKDREPDPGSPDAGFKQPIRIALEWVKADGSAPFYQRQAKIEAAAIQATMPLAYEMALDEIYKSEKYSHRMPSWLGQPDLPVEASANRVENQVGLIGALATSAPGNALLNALVTQPALARLRDAEYRSRRVATLIASQATPNRLFGLVSAYQDTPASEYLPASAIRDKLAAKVEEKLSQNLATRALEKVREYLDAQSRATAEDSRKVSEGTAALGLALAQTTPGMAPLAPALQSIMASLHQQAGREKRSHDLLAMAATRSPWLTAAMAWTEKNVGTAVLRGRLAEMIRELGLETGRSERSRDRFDIADDPGLKPLWQGSQKDETGPRAVLAKREFARQFFSQGDAASLYQPNFLSNNNQYLYWRTAVEPAYVPKFEEVRSQVEKRWKLEKARKAAQEAAEKLAAEARKAKGDADRNLRDWAKRTGGQLSYLEHVARLVPMPEAIMSRFYGRSFEKYQVPPEDVEYPTPNFVDKLLDMKERGDVAVEHDEPEMNYYVATLIRRSEPHPISFYADASRPEGLLQKYQESTEYQTKFRESCLAQLRSEAKLNYNEETLKNWRVGRSEE
jgi:hypothetical protein